MKRQRSELTELLDLIEDAGGSWSRSKDGHVKVYARSGRFVYKASVGKLTQRWPGFLRRLDRQIREG